MKKTDTGPFYAVLLIIVLIAFCIRLFGANAPKPPEPKLVAEKDATEIYRLRWQLASMQAQLQASLTAQQKAMIDQANALGGQVNAALAAACKDGPPAIDSVMDQKPVLVCPPKLPDNKLK